jgi:hypothetical protein
MSEAAPLPARSGNEREVGQRILDEEHEEMLVKLAAGPPSLTVRQTTASWNRQHPDREISTATCGRILKRALARMSEETAKAVTTYRERQKHQIESLMRVPLAIAFGSKCTVCNGEKTVPKDKLDPDLGVQVCPKCDGSGRNESDDTRLRAVSTVKGLLEREAKLLGLDMPTQLDVTEQLSVAIDVAGISDEGLQTEIQGFFARAPQVVDATVVDDEADPAPALPAPGDAGSARTDA